MKDSAAKPSPDFRSLQDVADAFIGLPGPDNSAIEAAQARERVLTKPAGALGRLEDLSVWYAGWRGDARPQVGRAQTLIFAGNHGVAARGVSPFPSTVTEQMVANFRAGGAAVNQLSDLMGSSLTITPIRLDAPTADFTTGPAMDEAEFLEAVSIGWSSVAREIDCLLLGEMGIGNTTAAAALTTLLYGGDPESWTGPGAGASGETLDRKIAVVTEGVARHREAVDAAHPDLAPIEALRRVGGREMAALFGALLHARKRRTPVLLDGFIVCAAAAAAARTAPDALAHCQAAHRSAEPGHDRLLKNLGLDPLLDLGLRLGEGTGAVLAFGVLQSALACHSGMATFEEAGVSGRDG